MQVDKHIDTSCPGVPSENPTSTTAPAAASASGSSSRGSGLFAAASTPQQPAKPPPERLPFLNYSILTDQALRKKLSALGVSSSGNRQLLERRHKEWVTLWNANCDSSRPKRKGELLQDLSVWERTVGAPAPSRSSALGAQIKDKDFDGEAWASKHESSFKDLIANARRTRSKAKQQPVAAAAGDQAVQEGSASNPEPHGTGVEQPQSHGEEMLHTKEIDKAELTSPLSVRPQGDLYHARAGPPPETCDTGLAIVGGQQPPQLNSVHDGNIQGA